MIRFSARGAYLLWCLKGGRLFGTGLISFLRNNRMLKRNLNIYLKTNSNRNCNSNKYWQLTWRTYLDNKLVGHVAMELSFLIFTFLKKARSENKVPVKGTGKRTCCPWILPRQNDEQSSRHKIWRRDHSFEEFMHSRGHKTTVFVMWYYRSFVGNQRKMNLGWYVPVL